MITETDIDNMTDDQVSEFLLQGGDVDSPAAEVEQKEEPVDEMAEEKQADEIDYKAMYEENQSQLNQLNSNFNDLQSQFTESQKEPEPEPDTRTLYEQAIDEVELTKEQQSEYDDRNEYDEESANQYKHLMQQQKVLETVLDFKKEQQDNQAASVVEQEKQEAYQRQQQQQAYDNLMNDMNIVIQSSKNMKGWQTDKDIWANVGYMQNHLESTNKDYAALSPAEQMKELEQRYAKVAGVDSDFGEKPSIDNVIAEAEKITPPSSLSSVSGGDPSAPGEPTITNATTDEEMDRMVAAAAKKDLASGNTGAMDRLLSSMDI